MPFQQHRSLYAADGRRKYLNSDERRAFLDAAARDDHEICTLCLTLAYTGCRISEALSLTVSSVQSGENLIAIRSLKKRGKVVVREIPVPAELVRLLLEGRGGEHPDTLLWSFGRTFAWRRVKEVMARAGVTELHASPRGLRHGFAVSAVLAGVPLTLVQKWLGHASLTTTAIYSDVVGPEEREIARRMWS
ncbi:site-specific integrase [Mesorhizobium sp. Z1-4]|uniref:tyrosine-type recombinase/integrase n=1 Tax=Mesorhizobium sp. Z1-4 TaxID=2448478 RepID=UPI000FDBA087|nr:site-specific integrase [Mesorhizobium sp. Z1-4]